MKALPRRFSNTGPITDYLNSLADARQHDIVEGAIAAVRSCLSTPDGAILLDLLSKSTEEFFLSPLADARALDALNAQRFIALDLRRIMSDEYEAHKLDTKAR
jgi:hypothetical protein